ncbi:hypothetical protein E1B28_006550 [Marasmius oreades]|uniref:F-box domain-containing protein n=1 Tax=Marasmius oreades TaxID=181124 RepID=A0A9P7S6S9_9AGAR|nr:uncharacterized protein E1B28_006550 [Marasmius oreades]KAG7095857.1 hypothetical protein E1B28_006550 [Marasmius oreades]
MFVALPNDILYEIAEQLRYVESDSKELTKDDSDEELFLKSGWTTFSSTRFYLSSFSKTSRRIRPIVEGVLYRDIHVDNLGWIPPSRRSWHNDKLQTHPAGSLLLLIRTLIRRPSLSSFVRGVDLRWCDGQDAIALQELSAFLRNCPRLLRFSISDLDEELLGVLETLKLQISSFATSCYSYNMERVTSCFPRLQTLQLFLHGPPILFTTPSSTHSIRRMRFHLHVSLEKFDRTCQSVLKLAGQSVEELSIVNGVHTKECPTLPFLATSTYTRLESLCVKEIDLFESEKHPSILTSMVALRHLHVMRCRVLPLKAFQCIPENISSITFSVYGAGEPDAFLSSLVQCIRLGIASSSWLPKGIRAEGCPSQDHPGNLVPLKDLCITENVRFEEVNSGSVTRKLTVLLS